MSSMATHPAAHVKASKARRTSPRPNPYAVCQAVAGTMLVNAHADTLHTCPHCKAIEYKSGRTMQVSYAHKRTSAQHCDECEADRVALLGIALEREGINLGWGTADHSREYEREAHQQYRAR